MIGWKLIKVFGGVYMFKGIFAQEYISETDHVSHVSDVTCQDQFLWNTEKCAEVTPGYFQCDNYLRPVFTLTNVQLVNRTFAVMSLLLMAGVLILMLIGMGTV